MTRTSEIPAAPDGDRGNPMPVVAMVGGGQLARMTHQAAIGLGQCLRVLAASPDEPAAQVSADVVLGSHDRVDDLRAVARGAHAVTFDHEHVPCDALRQLESEGVRVAPPSSALIFAQDKLAMRRRLAELDAPIPDFVAIDAVADVEAFGAKHDWAIVLKTVRGGYDGRGVWLPSSRDEACAVVADQLDAGVPMMAEQRVAMRRELSAMVARSPFGQGAVWPVVQTVQVDGQCAEVIAPAPHLSESVAAQAQQLALRLASELGVAGVMAVELFETEGGVLVNELAMRPHNSGHWGMDGAVTGQFEQHLRAVLDYPLGDTSPLRPVTVMANILGAPQAPSMSLDERLHHLCGRMPDARVHLYGKGERPHRKIGHVNILGGRDGSPNDDAYVAQVRERAARAAHWMSHAQWTDGWEPEH